MQQSILATSQNRKNLWTLQPTSRDLNGKILHNLDKTIFATLVEPSGFEFELTYYARYFGTEKKIETRSIIVNDVNVLDFSELKEEYIIQLDSSL